MIGCLNFSSFKKKEDHIIYYLINLLLFSKRYERYSYIFFLTFLRKLHYILTKLLVKLTNECNKLKIYVGLLKTTNKTIKSVELGKMFQMKQWNVYYVVLAIDFYIPGRRIYWKTAILKRDVEKKSWLINSGKKVFDSTLMLLGFRVSANLMTGSGPYKPWHGDWKMKACTLTVLLKDLTWAREAE